MRERPAYLRELAAFAADTSVADLSPAARERARWVLADCVPVMAAGMQEREMRAFTGRHLGDAATGRAWVIGAKRRAARSEEHTSELQSL